LSTEFDGVNEFVLVGDVPELAFDFADPFSISCWINSTTAAVGAIVSKEVGSGFFEGYALFIDAAGHIVMRLEGGGANNNKIEGASGQGGLQNGSWHHIVTTYDGSSTLAGMRIYINTVNQTLINTFNAASNSMLTTTPFQLARRDVDRNYAGLLDEVAVYDVELSAAQVTLLYNGGRPDDLALVGPTGNLVGWWRMGEGATFPVIPDESPSGNDGTMTNMEAGDIKAITPGS
jgi:hypothetical protein